MLRGLFSGCGEQGLLSSSRGAGGGCVWASHRGGSSCCGAWALVPTDLSSVAPRLESPGPAALMHGLSCSAACGLPRPGVELVSPALAGGDSLPLSHQESPQAYFRLVFQAPIW